MVSTNVHKPDDKKPVKLDWTVQHYAWGSLNDGLVAKLANNNDDKPCAELWMGTHPSGPSIDHESGRLLEEVIGKKLPFLFKVLSVKKALSIQAHPDKQLAKELHARDPKNYPDPNHKPEMTIAVTPFEALSSFRMKQEIDALWEKYPELTAIANPTDSLREMFGKVMRADRETATRVAESILTKYGDIEDPLITLFKRLWIEYPFDVGCFCVFLLNYVCLNPGEAIFLAANEPHAYLSGDCIECMAASDNVVRAGLTPKYRDLDTLLKMLTYREFKKEDLLVKPFHQKGGKAEYAVPVDEFAVLRGESDSLDCVVVEKDALIIFIDGEGSLHTQQGEKYGYAPGSVYYFYPGSTVTIEPNVSSTWFMAYQP